MATENHIADDRKKVRLIDATDALELLKNAEKEMMVVQMVGCKVVDIDAVIRFIETRPTVDSVEVVRCKDCKHWKRLNTSYGWCEAWEQSRLAPGYCHCGERVNHEES